MLIQNNLCSRIETTEWIVIEKTLNTNFMITLEICLWDPFDIIAMTPRGSLGLCCVHIAQLMTHPVIYTMPFTLQLFYKPLGILQRVTKSQKVHISSHDGLKTLHIKFTWHRPHNVLEKKQSSRNFPFPNQIFWTKNTPLWLTKRIFSNDQKEQIVNNFKKLDNVHWNVATIQLLTCIYINLSHSHENPVPIMLLKIFFIVNLLDS